jgi:uncharacterized protein
VTIVDIREGAFRETDGGGWVLLGERDPDSGTVRFPATGAWPRIELGARATLFSWSTVHMPSAHFTAPYTVGYVEFPEGVKVFAPLRVAPDTELRAGVPMALEIDELWDGVRGYRFVPEEEQR